MNTTENRFSLPEDFLRELAVHGTHTNVSLHQDCEHCCSPVLVSYDEVFGDYDSVEIIVASDEDVYASACDHKAVEAFCDAELKRVGV